ncbi:MAG: hypothetical protein LBI61_01525 [Puniceicoccales bacterium]|jgi:Flp pilus assembly protein TadD|nr:hypothetical protein [Puniceicoccales bacterium]
MSNATKLVDMPVSSELVRLLMDVGYVATGRGLQTRAEAVFAGAIAARPNSEFPLIGLGVCKINFGDFVAAAKILSEKALKINPSSGLAKCFLAIAVKSLGRKDYAYELASQVITSCEETAAVTLAKSIVAGRDVAQ